MKQKSYKRAIAFARLWQLTQLLIVSIIAGPLFAHAQNINSPWPTAPGSWYVMDSSDFCAISDPRQIPPYRAITAPSVAALADAVVAENQRNRDCQRVYNPPSYDVVPSVISAIEGQGFGLYSSFYPRSPGTAPGFYNGFFTLGSHFRQTNPDPAYLPPTCSSGPLSAFCQNMGQSGPPGFSAIGCTQPIDPKNLGPSHSCSAKPSAGNPVDVGTGNKYQLEWDYQRVGISPLEFSRTYNSSTIVQLGAFGANWRSTFERSLKLYELANKTTAAVFRPDGKILYFSYANGVFTSSGEISDKLTAVSDATGKTTGFTYLLAATDELEEYDNNGRLFAITNRSKIKQSLTYDTYGRLITVTDSFGKKLQFSSTYPIRSMIDPAGGVTHYEYGPNYQLASVTYPDGKVRKYVYDSRVLDDGLTGIIDENGKRFATWSYDAQGRVVSSEHAGGAEKTTFTYGTNSTQVTDALASSRTYNFETVLGVVRSTGQSQPGGSGCAAASNSITYDANGNIASRKDFNGNLTTYTYDLQRNLETSRIEAPGTTSARTISTEWSPGYRLPARIATPKLLITFSYDALGNLLTKTEQPTTDLNGAAKFNATSTGPARTWRYTYNAVGQILTATGPRTDISDQTTYAYDANGNLATFTNSVGQVTQFTSYDWSGRLLTMTAPNGAVTTMTYAPRGWLLTSSTVAAGSSDPQNTRFTYDGVGQINTATFPDGSVISYSYDDAHRLTTVADSVGNTISYTLDKLGNRIGETATDPVGTLARSTARVYDALNRLQQVTGGVQ